MCGLKFEIIHPSWVADEIDDRVHTSLHKDATHQAIHELAEEISNKKGVYAINNLLDRFPGQIKVYEDVP